MVSWMGKVSFEVYLVHCIFIEDAIFPFWKFFGNDGLCVLNYVIASFALACLLQRLTAANRNAVLRVFRRAGRGACQHLACRSKGKR